MTATLAGNPGRRPRSLLRWVLVAGTSVDAAATTTAGNGTALFTAATLGQAYSGAGGIPPECAYSSHAGVSLPFILFVQVARPTNATGMTCPL